LFNSDDRILWDMMAEGTTITSNSGGITIQFRNVRLSFDNPPVSYSELKCYLFQVWERATRGAGE